MENKNIDAFILFNERESGVAAIVEELESRGISTYFWRRDVGFGETWEELEETKLKEARTVLVFLGKTGWGPNHLRITREAQTLEKRIIPVLIGDVSDEDLQGAGGLFRNRRYSDLRTLDPIALTSLADAVLKREPSRAAIINLIINTLINGSEEQRAGALRHIQISTSINRPALAERLRAEIEDRFDHNSPTQLNSSAIDPSRIPSIRSWMISSLIWANAEETNNRSFILKHLNSTYEPIPDVRYWILAGLYQSKASYLVEALSHTSSDNEPEIRALARAIQSPTNPETISRFRSDLNSSDFESTVWPVLRVFRVIAIPELASTICELFNRSSAGTDVSYDALYALSNPVMAQEAAKLLSTNPGLKSVVARVIAECLDANSNVVRSFTVLLAAFDPSEVDLALREALSDATTSDTAKRLLESLNEYQSRDNSNELLIAGYASELIDISKDPLDIREDVQTLTAVMLAKDVKPPLAIGLFGHWGSGKSYFMKSMKAAAETLAGKAKFSGNMPFCSNIVSIEFNAWHYVDTNLWASLVSHILEQMAAYVNPKLSPEEQQAALLKELGSAQAVVTEVQAEKARAQEAIKYRQTKLQDIQTERQKREIELRQLRVSDFRNLISEQKNLTESLDQTGIPAVINSVSDLSQVISEAYTIRGRVTAIFMAMTNRDNKGLRWFLLLVVLVIPVLVFAFFKYVWSDDLMARLSAIIAQIVTIIAAVATFLRKGIDKAKENLTKLENAKNEVDKIIAEKRNAPSEEEEKLEKEIASLNVQEQEVASRLSIATARVLELEERIRVLTEGQSLSRFLANRTSSDDYRKYLGLIATIRQDFEALNNRLTKPLSKPDGDSRSVDRIILYIDDLDRCPANKVMEVLQAVHLLLAYPLFVVVVGVDPRWLLHSLRSTYSAFRSDNNPSSANSDLWRTTPQNYLEKIFQIPFTLRSMSATGYGNLVKGLLSPSEPPKQQEAANSHISTAAPPTSDDQRQAAEQRSNQSAKPQPDDATQENQTDSNNDKSDSASKVHESGSSDKIDDKQQFVLNKESLVIKPWEVKYAESLFDLIPTPRAAKRFSNIYRILKASVHRDLLQQFEGTAEVPGEFQVPMLLLAMLIGNPIESASLFPRLQNHAAAGHNVMEALQQFKWLELDSENFKSLEKKIRPVIDESGFPQAPEVFLEWIPRVSRFSFDLGRVVQPLTARQN